MDYPHRTPNEVITSSPFNACSLTSNEGYDVLALTA